jgi:hypothetical protein
MKKYILIVGFVLCALFTMAQPVVNNAYCDTLKVSKRDGTPAEFILKNATKTVTGGVLTNVGNGRTEFVIPSAGTVINGTGFVKASGTTISYDNSTYLSTSSAASTYQPLLGYTPYNATNPSGYITSSALSPYLTTSSAASTYATVAMNGTKLDTSGAYIHTIVENADALYNAATYSRTNHVGYLTQNLATQTSYKLFGTGSTSATPTFRYIDSNYFNNSFAAQVRNTISLTTTGTSGAATYNSSTGVFNIPQYSGGGSSYSAGRGLNLISTTFSLDTTKPYTWTAKQTIQLTTEQLRLGYDASNFVKFTVGSGGALTMTPSIGSANIFNWTKTDGTTSILSIDAGNRFIGIGNTAPAVNLHITGFSTGADGTARIEGSTGGYGGNLQLNKSTDGATTDYLGRIQFLNNGTERAAIKSFQTETINTTADLRFYTSTASTESERMRIQTTGGILVNTTTNVASSIFTITSTTQGFLVPRMTTTQKNAISSPAEGLEVYDLTLHQRSYYNGTTWINY